MPKNIANTQDSQINGIITSTFSCRKFFQQVAKMVIAKLINYEIFY